MSNQMPGYPGLPPELRPSPFQVLSPEEAAAGSDSQAWNFPVPVLFTVYAGLQVYYPAGLHQVPNVFGNSGWWYFEAAGVTLADPPAAVTIRPGLSTTSSLLSRLQMAADPNHPGPPAVLDLA